MTEKQIRARLLQYLGKRGGRPVEEISLAWNLTRIDVVAMLGGRLCGFEIKSDYDSLVLLDAQARRYRRYFGKLYLVTGERHLAGALEILPSYWGVWVVRPSLGGVQIVRRSPPAASPRANRHQKAAPLAALMTKGELIELLAPHVSDDDLETMTRTALSRLAAETLEIPEIEKALFEAWHARRRLNVAAVVDLPLVADEPQGLQPGG